MATNTEDYQVALQAYRACLGSVQTRLEIQDEFAFNTLKAKELTEEQQELLDSIDAQWRKAQFYMSCRAIRTPLLVWRLWCNVRNLNVAEAGGKESAKVLLTPTDTFSVVDAPIMLTRSLPPDEAAAIGVIKPGREDLLLGVGVSIPDECVDSFARVYRLRWDDKRQKLYADILKGDSYDLYGGVNCDDY